MPRPPVQEFVHDIEEAARRKAHRALAEARDGLNHAALELGHGVEDLAEEARARARRLRKAFRRQPLAALGLAFAVGAVLGALTAPRR